ncbi:MAG: hypothetical protein AABW92_03550 [Nanoarchaeota archaeon]
MVSKPDKFKSTQFICDLLEESGLYRILQKDYIQILLEQHPKRVEHPKQAQIVVPNFYGNIKSYQNILDENRQKGTITIPVLYKDGSTAFVRMVDTNRSWRTDKSLKKYLPQKINQMLHLRGIEKAVLRDIDFLQYYQPETERLHESIREFQLENVVLDYSHLENDDLAKPFIRDGPAISYKMPVETQQITGPVKIVPTKRGYIAALKPYQNQI